MTGGTIGIAFAIWALVGSLPAVLFGLVGVVAVFVACYLLWRDERFKRFSIQNELLLEKQNVLNSQINVNKLTTDLIGEKEKFTPRLKTEIITSACGTYIQPDNKQFTALTFVIEVTNLGGMPSVAKDWRMDVFVEGNVFKCLPPPFPKFTLGVVGALDTVLKDKDYLADKTFTPITSGAMIRGFLVFFVPYPKELVNVKGTKTIIRFRDSTGQDYEIINDHFPYQNPSGFVEHIPGMEIKKETIKRKTNKKPRWKK